MTSGVAREERRVRSTKPIASTAPRDAIRRRVERAGEYISLVGDDHEAGAPGTLAIETRGLTRRFGDVVAVDAVDLAVSAGSVFGLLGSNGAGKSTVIKVLTTLLAPDAGAARVAGFDVVADAMEVRRRIGYVPQLLSADGGLTGRENLELSARLHGLSRRERRERIDDALRLMGLEADAPRLVRTYSGGMVRRLEIAQSMLHRPAVLFLDEPTTGLDPVARRTVHERLRELRERFGTTMLLTTHDMEEAETLCDRVAFMAHGRLALEGIPRELEHALGATATLEDVFVRATGGAPPDEGRYRDVASARRNAARVG